MNQVELRPACRYVARMIREALDSDPIEDRAVADGMVALLGELLYRGTEPDSLPMTNKQRIRELRRKDPTNPLYWTSKQKARAARKGLD